MKKILVCGILILMIAAPIVHRTSNHTTNNHIIHEVFCPDSNYKAIVYARNIDATTRESYHLSVLKKHTPLNNRSGNIFITYSNFDVEWKDSHTLLVKVYDRQQIFKQEVIFNNVKIQYEHVETQEPISQMGTSD